VAAKQANAYKKLSFLSSSHQPTFLLQKIETFFKKEGVFLQTLFTDTNAGGRNE